VRREVLHMGVFGPLSFLFGFRVGIPPGANSGNRDANTVNAKRGLNRKRKSIVSQADIFLQE
jgi:hypothetical protein